MIDDPWWDELQKKSHWRLCHEIGHLRDLLKNFAPVFWEGYIDAIYGIPSRKEWIEDYVKGYESGINMRKLDDIK